MMNGDKNAVSHNTWRRQDFALLLGLELPDWLIDEDDGALATALNHGRTTRPTREGHAGNGTSERAGPQADRLRRDSNRHGDVAGALPVHEHENETHHCRHGK